MHLQLGGMCIFDLDKGCQEEVVRPQNARGIDYDISVFSQDSSDQQYRVII